MHYRTIGDVKVDRRRPANAEIGDVFYDDDDGCFYIFYGKGVGWLQVNLEDLNCRDGC